MIVAIEPGVLMSEDPATITVRIDSELARMARIICAHTPGRNGKQLKLVDYLDTLLRNPITTRYEEIMQDIAKQQGSGKTASRKKKSDPPQQG